jgi:hypothetical protein
MERSEALAAKWSASIFLRHLQGNLPQHMRAAAMLLAIPSSFSKSSNASLRVAMQVAYATFSLVPVLVVSPSSGWAGLPYWRLG